jgi:hypothetical protein
MPFLVAMPDKTPCALPYDFIRKTFRINHLEDGLYKAFSIYGHFSRKKRSGSTVVRLQKKGGNRGYISERSPGGALRW